MWKLEGLQTLCIFEAKVAKRNPSLKQNRMGASK
jgi:hypothetical protein